jgi:endonuclease/exonuclease/phosphatase (EEP) superfamily protein YafD
MKAQMQTSLNSPWRLARIGTVLLVSSMMGSCAVQPVDQPARGSANLRDFQVRSEIDIDACRISLRQRDARGLLGELDSNNIRIVNWNVQKTRKPGWQRDYDAFTSDKELVLIQEASLREDTINKLDSSKHWAFAPGYGTDGEISGVLNLSTIKPMTQCSFVTLEPVIRKPKATSITQYGMSATDETLVVVNMHAVNFSLGLGAFREQFERIAAVLAEHRGPLILSGDFNTWRLRRQQIVGSVVKELGLRPLVFEIDHRVQVLGRTIDHIYVRGLSTVATATNAVTTSDHNPMSATLTM